MAQGNKYRNPPKHAQFKKGQSGNPAGRPKGKLNLATVLQKTLAATVEVIEDGQKKTVTKMEAAVARLVDKAIEGDVHAFRVLSLLTQILQDPTAQPSVSDLEGADQKLIQSLVRRFGKESEAADK